jgi:hypothetical protein
MERPSHISGLQKRSGKGPVSSSVRMTGLAYLVLIRNIFLIMGLANIPESASSSPVRYYRSPIFLSVNAEKKEKEQDLR